MRTTERIAGIFGDTLLDTTPTRPNELKTSEDFQRERRADEISATDLAKRYGVSVADMESWIEKYSFPGPVRSVLVKNAFGGNDRVTWYSQSASAKWDGEILAVASKVKR